MIEHRHTKRVAVSDTVSIYHRGTLVANCKTKDLSVDGMALWAGPLQYHRKTMLEVEFASGVDARQSLRLPAIVVYSATKVLGLMFTQSSNVTETYLRTRMNHAGIQFSAQGNQDQDRDNAISAHSTVL
ncbi:MAG: PilZ domain-containing protein [Gammaproteobacteria bacterium]|jgi:hypothetical protein|nr:PilZ domain-containing protein [Gammaproteobacteria bacterium]